MSQSTSSFKNIEPVPTGTDFLDIVLSRTQRQLPTVIRPGFKISRIRAFYARKVKYTQESFTEKLEAILTQFPRLDSIHPFHADLVAQAVMGIDSSLIFYMIKSIIKSLWDSFLRRSISLRMFPETTSDY
jgi:GTP1/Obg family GTP-binding protein